MIEPAECKGNVTISHMTQLEKALDDLLREYWRPGFFSKLTLQRQGPAVNQWIGSFNMIWDTIAEEAQKEVLRVYQDYGWDIQVFEFCIEITLLDKKED